MKSIFKIVFILSFQFNYINVYAQPVVSDSIPSCKIAVFAPLYLDSVFNSGAYKYDKRFPRFILPALDFVLGAQIALDTLGNSGAKIEARVYDSKSTSKKISSLLDSRELDSTSLIIGSVKDDEYLMLANYARKKNIPFISATYPNDGGITENPNLYIINSTLKTHCESIFSYLLQNHSGDNILFVRKKGNQEDRITGYFNNINKPDANTLLNINNVQIDSNFNVVIPRLDSTKKNIIIGGSMDEQFGNSLAELINSVSGKYDLTLIGMPNWDGFKFKKNADYAFIYTTPYYNDKNNPFSKYIDDAYLKKYKKNPSDFTYKGFETVFSITSLLIKHNKSLSSKINDSSFNVFSDFNFIPVFGEKKDIPHYYENKHLFILKKSNGIVSRIQ